MGSADLMQRNLDRRVEQVYPLEDPDLRYFIRHHVLEFSLRDNTRARVLQPDGSYQRLVPEPGEEAVDSQTLQMGYHAYASTELEHKTAHTSG
jgi:polyphosphate kinase